MLIGFAEHAIESDIVVGIQNSFLKKVIGSDFRAISTVVAHFLHTEGVTGSNPVSPIDMSIKELFVSFK